MPVRAGRLKKRVHFQSFTNTTNDYGEDVPTWSDYASRWAAVEPISSREFFGGAQTQSDLTHRVMVRDGDDLDGLIPKHRIRFGSRTLQIASIINKDERGEQLELLCREVTT